jgi:hypothetical protein
MSDAERREIRFDTVRAKIAPAEKQTAEKVAVVAYFVKARQKIFPQIVEMIFEVLFRAVEAERVQSGLVKDPAAFKV